MLSTSSDDTRIHDPLLSDQEIEPDFSKTDTTGKTYLKQNWFNKGFFLWVSDLIAIAKKKTFQQDMHYGLRDSEAAWDNFKRMQKTYNALRSTSKRPLIAAIYTMYKAEFWLSIFIAVLAGCVQMTTPFMIKLLIDFMEEATVDVSRGVGLLLGIFGLRFAYFMLQCHLNFRFNLFGIKMSNSVITMIYDKSLKFAFMRSKTRSLGSITNYLQTDAQTLFNLSLLLAGAIASPLQLIIGIVILSTQVGLSFVSGFGVIILGMILNAIIGKKYQE